MDNEIIGVLSWSIVVKSDIIEGIISCAGKMVIDRVNNRRRVEMHNGQ